MTARRVRRIAWTCFGLTIAFIPLSAWIVTRPQQTPLSAEDVWSISGAFLGALAISAIGALILGRHPRHAIGWTFTLSGLATAGAVVCAAYGHLAEASGGTLPAGAPVAEIAYVLLQGGVFLPLTIGLLLFPNGRLLSRRWWPAALAAGAGLLLRLVGDTMDPSGANPVADWISNAGVLVTVASAAAGLVSLAVRWRRADSILRQQLKWMTAAAGLVVFLSWPT